MWMPMHTKRSMRSSNKFDLIFVFVISMAFLVCAWLLYSEGWNAPGSPRTENVGTITYKNRVAERKVNGEVLWSGLSQNAPVYNSDTVHTTMGSSAVIHLKDGTEISLGEGTMVLVSVEEKGTTIGVSGGLVAVHRAAPEPAHAGPASPGRVRTVTPVIMTTRTGTVSFDSGSLSIADCASGTSVDVEEGIAKVTSGSLSRDVGPGSVVELGGSGSLGTPFVPLEPRQGQTLFADGESSMVNFTWTTGSGPDLPSVQLIVAADSEFRRIEYKGMAPVTGAAHAFPEGPHYWKLSTRGTETSPRWFNVAVLRPPTLLEPSDNQTFAFSDNPPVVSFAWVPPHPALSYRLEVFPVIAEGMGIASTTTTLSNLALDSLKEGDYRWRVVAVSGKDAPERASRTLNFSIRKSRLTAPDPVRTGSPDEQEIVLSAAAIANGSFMASWNEVEGADRYAATVSRDAEAADVVATVVTRSNALRLDEPLKPGRYYVRVRAISGASRSDASAAIPVRVVEAIPLRVIAPIDGSSLEPGSRDISFRWSDPNEGLKYRVVLSEDASFDRQFMTANSTVRLLQTEFPRDRSGAVFWKVELLNDSGAVAASSRPSSFFIPQLFQDPKPISPIDGELVDVYASDSIPFRWNPIPGADEYRVTLYRMNGAFKSPIQSWTTDKSSITLDKFTDLSAASFAWELSARSMSGDRIVGQSRAVLSYFHVAQSHALEAPKNVFFGKRNRR